MPRLLLLLAVIIAIYLLLRRARSMPPHKRRGEYIKLGLGIAVVVVVIATLAGRMNWVGAALTGLLVVARQLLPTLVRMFPMLASLRGQSAPRSGQSSTVETALLRMLLDHDTGNLQGEVLAGHFKGWRLAEMDKQQLAQLQAYCHSQDPDSEQLLASYLEQRFPGEAPFGQQHCGTQGTTAMGRGEALAVLGLADGTSKQDILDAHRQLMQKFHPDRGGSDYLAAKINQAKDFLLP